MSRSGYPKSDGSTDNPALADTSCTSGASDVNRTPRNSVPSVPRNWSVSPEVRAKIMSGRIFAQVKENVAADLPNPGFGYWASKWPELNEVLDGDDTPKQVPKDSGTGKQPLEDWAQWDLEIKDFLQTSWEVAEEGSGGNGRHWTLDDFELGEMLGRGSYGKVRVATERTSGLKVALKSIRKQTVDRKKLLQLKREITIQSFLLDQHVCRLLGYFLSNNHIYLILEHAPNGTLANLIRTHDGGHLPQPDSALYMFMLCSGLAYLHGMDIIHRDIKPENLLLGPGNILKVADFGWAVPENPSPRTRIYGTVDYLPPEMLDPEPSLVTTRLDMWSAGIVLYEMVVGRTPFRGASRKETFQNIKRGECSWPQPPTFFLVRKLVGRLLRQDPKRRPEAIEVLEDRWIWAFTD